MYVVLRMNYPLHVVFLYFSVPSNLLTKKQPMKKIILLIACFSLFTFGVFSQDKDPQADLDWSTYDFSSHYTLKNGGGKKTFDENKRIYIANFQISQIIVANGKATGVSNLAKMTVGMSPIDIAKYQALVDKLYEQTKARLVAEGYTLVTDEEVANTEFAKKEHNAKSIFCQYVPEPVFAKDASGNDIVYIWPKNKFIVLNTNPILGNWPSKFGKAINANAVSITLIINSVSFDGSRGGGRKGASIEATANMTVAPWCFASNERGGFGVWCTALDGKANWVGPKGMAESNSKTDVFGSVRGTYVLDVNEEAYLAEVETVAGGMAKGYIDALMKEIK